MINHYIGLWFDKNGGHDPRWIVSRDTDETTDTVASYAPDDYYDAVEHAKKDKGNKPCKK
jgi:hypothetical protein